MKGATGSHARVRRRLRVASALVAVAVSGGAAWAQAQKTPPPQPADKTPVQTVWPLPPDEPRVRYVAVYESKEDVTDSKATKASSLRAMLLGKDSNPAAKKKKRTLEKPFGVAVDGYGRMLVTDPFVGGVVVIDPQSGRITTLTDVQRQATFRVPIGVAVDADNNFYIGDNGLGRILVFGPDLAYRRTIGAEGEVQTPSGLAIDDARRRLYVVDTRRHVVVAYDLGTGRIVARVGKRGVGNGEFNYPTGVAVGPDGVVYVTDTMNCRVEVFDSDLKFLRTFGSQGITPGQFLRPKGIAVDGDNVVYVVDSDFNNFQLLTSTGQPLMFVGDIGQRPGQMLLPAGIAIDRSRRKIYVCEQVNARVQVFERVGGSGY
jgi:DNA-binding beta-propeller fold protein YncE